MGYEFMGWSEEKQSAIKLANLNNATDAFRMMCNQEFLCNRYGYYNLSNYNILTDMTKYFEVVNRQMRFEAYFAYFGGTSGLIDNNGTLSCDNCFNRLNNPYTYVYEYPFSGKMIKSTDTVQTTKNEITLYAVWRSEDKSVKGGGGGSCGNACQYAGGNDWWCSCTSTLVHSMSQPNPDGTFN